MTPLILTEPCEPERTEPITVLVPHERERHRVVYEKRRGPVFPFSAHADGRAFRYARKAAGLSLAEAAERLGLTGGVLYGIEIGRRRFLKGSMREALRVMREARHVVA